MIALLGSSALILAALQASAATPTSAFRGCLHDAASKATSQKVSPDTIDTYLRNACTVQMGTLKEALVALRVKNGMSRKDAAEDAQMAIDDYVSTPVDNYKFMATQGGPTKPDPAPPPAKPPAQPTSNPHS